jgi:Lon protease-like protein
MGGLMEIPIFPLGSVLFPGGRLPLQIFEPRYVAMTRACIRDNSVFGVSLIRAGYEVGKPAVPCEVGCTARIVEWEATEPERYLLLAQGETVFRLIRRRTRGDGLILGEVELQEPPDPTPLPPRHEPLLALLRRFIERFGAMQLPNPLRLDDAAWVSCRLAELLPVTPERKQALLETGDPLRRLERIEQLLLELGQGQEG